MASNAEVVRIVEQLHVQTNEAIERGQQAQRDGFRQLSESIDRLVDRLGPRNGVSTTSNGMNFSFLFGIAGMLAALFSPLYAWQNNLETRLSNNVGSLMHVDDLSLQDRRKHDNQITALQQSTKEIETQFAAMWLALNEELYTQDRLNQVLWDSFHKDSPWRGRTYYPSMHTRNPNGSNE